MKRALHPHRLRRGLAAAGATAVAVGLIAATPSQAALTGSSPYEIEGAVPDGGATFFPDLSGGNSELGPAQGVATKLGVIHSAPKPMLSYTNPNAGVDLKGVWLDSDPSPVDGDTWLYLGWERDSRNGSGAIMYEFQTSPEPAACTYAEPEANWRDVCNPFENRQPGDFILVWDQSGSSAKIILRTWGFTASSANPTWEKGEPLVLDAGVELTNSVTAYALYSADKTRGEAAVNLTDTIFAAASNQCTTVGNVVPGTVTGNSDTADYKDVVLADFADKVTISNCGSVKIKKETVNRDGTALSTGAGSFVTRLNRADDSDLTYAKAATSTTPAVPAVKLYDDTHVVTTGTSAFTTHADLKAGTNYRLAETSAATGYELYSIQCKVGSGAFANASGLNFEVKVGVTTECVVKNQPALGTLVIKKVVVNDNGGALGTSDFSYALNGATGVTFPVDGSAGDQDAATGTAAVSVSLAHGAAFAVTEPEANTRGYATTLLGCTGSITAGQTSTCTITNNDRAAQLTVVKTVDNDNGGTKVVADFPLFVGTTSVTSGVKNTFTPGNYTVSETQQTGYTAGAWGGDCAANGAVSLALGDDKTCTITNSDTKATPTGATIQRWVLHDSLTVSDRRATAPNAASATATFKVFSDTACTVQVGASEAVTIGAATSAQTVTGVAVSNPGTYYWEVTFSGDQYNNAFTTPCGSEEGAETTTITAVDDRLTP